VVVCYLRESFSTRTEDEIDEQRLGSTDLLITGRAHGMFQPVEVQNVTYLYLTN
jgi:hypothetical protein